MQYKSCSNRKVASIKNGSWLNCDELKQIFWRVRYYFPDAEYFKNELYSFTKVTINTDKKLSRYFVIYVSFFFS